MRKQCCEIMRINVERTCPDHPDRSDCPDCLVEYVAEYERYGILVHDGSSSMISINFCPWCGAVLEEGND
ncbi:MAG: hypothetical protein DI637_06195 [Citromicrobium sp.]|nr:MAG: hypothetical protein DI637_06195 [Citromicrobium sp.]